MTERFSPEQRARFRKLLTLAAESPFAGERAAALAAAERLAGRFAMTLDEAARACREPQGTYAGNGYRNGGPQGTTREDDGLDEDDIWAGMGAGPGNGAGAQPEWMRRAYSDYAYEAAASRARQEHREKVKQEQAREEQRRREEKAGRRNGSHRSRQRKSPEAFAQVLISETRLPLREIAGITGLSEHLLVGLKLKLRPIRRARAS